MLPFPFAPQVSLSLSLLRQIEIPALPPSGCVIPGKRQTSVPWGPSVNVKSPGPLTAGSPQESAFEPVLFLQQGPRDTRESC